MALMNQLSQQLGEALLDKGLVMTTAESCTGGGVATAVTDIAGSSAWFDRAFVTYSNEAKMEMLGVNASTLEAHGAVSEPVVTEMVAGALVNSQASIGVSISGVAGPGGGSEEKPVGTVCFGFQSEQGWQKIETCYFEGDRAQVRRQAVLHALQVLLQYLTE
ncbi:putative competence/damage-inducible protein [Vibrio nigripulchritudo MADA3029]|uniref:nicotinamide-nucleotide amidase n=1 Tax=Vibrio TaxID=662 RepID=UPI0003B1FE3A|nr:MULTISPECIES: nicotinamide-nucleotide amidase [Vibrio]UAB70758.1 nicotinamide-nucleotide amidase [Vibrio sp. SCSIO 43132]CCN50627.1 putative competence/damage-inducible protein [Vibrio nigripulchritudo MADA3020]CCN53836.1 putative competence/damage-inducible protein [Vibrio nigripulchritudo MADA3021]CCN59913.1 putative competence/damage-inducible protein [Vibrio nigripulchritudo MADA3029]BCL71230.1 competence damage-inducible protein A [Vibrio nigripulchritudo]